MQTNLTVERGRTHDQAYRAKGSSMNVRGSQRNLLNSNASAQSTGFNEKRIVKGGVSVNESRAGHKSCK